MSDPNTIVPAPPRIWPRTDLTDLLTLHPVSDRVFINTWYEPNSSGFLFGGQLLAQVLVAAAMTVPDREPNALHVFFVRPASGKVPVRYEVDLTRDGGQFSTRTVFARQGGQVLCQAMVSFQTAASGFEHQEAVAPPVPPPESTRTIRRIVADLNLSIDEARYERFLSDHVMEARYPEPEDLLLRLADASRMTTWFRPRTPIAPHAGFHAAALAYATDWICPYTAAMRHVRSVAGGELFPSSLNHAVWFHRPVRFDDWLLLATDSPIAGGGRGHTRGQVFTREGVLVASMAQESLMQRQMPGVRG
ncbi:MAG: acyl-CoA thioesterase [Gammaproteobacteria bacterium]